MKAVVEKVKGISEKKIVINLVPPSSVPMVWGQVEPWLEKGEQYTRGYYNNEHLYNAVINGQLHLWISSKGNKVKTIMLTQFDYYPECVQFRYVLIVGETGSFREIIPAFRNVELWAIRNGATKGCVIGRDGWEKKLAKFGYHKQSVMLVKELVMTNDQAWSQ